MNPWLMLAWRRFGTWLRCVLFMGAWGGLFGLVEVNADATCEKVPILAWHSVPEKELSLERFEELAAMGVTHSLMHYSPEGNLKALEFAERVGVKLMVSDGRFREGGEALRVAVKEYSRWSSLEGYSLRDEPSMADFSELSRIRRDLAAVDEEHWSYVNLFPTYASPAQLGSPTYLEHVRRFLLEFQPRILSFDHYPVLKGNQVRGNYYENLEWIRQGALEFGVPFWAFALTCPHHPYPEPTLASVRLQAWSNFAYGAKGLQYFTYWTPRPGTWDFHDAPIREDGTRSQVYELLKEFNREVQARADWILGSRVLAVYHTEPLPAGTRGLDLSSPLEAVEGGEALVSVSEDGETGSRWVLLVNRSLEKKARYHLKPRQWVRDLESAPGERVKVVRTQEGNGWTVDLEPGEGVLMRMVF